MDVTNWKYGRICGEGEEEKGTGVGGDIFTEWNKLQEILRFKKNSAWLGKRKKEKDKANTKIWKLRK